MKNKFEYVIKESDEGLQIKELLRRHYGFSSRLMRKFKVVGGVCLNGEPVKLYHKGVTGDLISVNLPEESSDFEPEDISICAAYEDEDLLVVNKQPGYVVHPTKGHPNHTIANGIMKYMVSRGEKYKIRFINRLDMDTSGLLIVAKNSHCQDDLSKQMAKNIVTKKYVAIVHGSFDEEEGIIDLPINRVSEDHVIRGVMENGYPSITRYRVLERFLEYSFLELHLETGRTHQIRVHMSHIGHPLVSDALYGKEEPELIERQALHAAYLSFRHPVSGEFMNIEAPIPKDMQNLLKKLREK
ncbi:RluA family pseudouridine synthase [Anaerovorax sp. IOR16]|uniref:RluA family pseudouridine synthase n=1 Tax=Anaerovorax sp. IOR16 TaxID=2773458 RepID=UPI0019D2AF55|nr:RluA family pseudouridine synthase [Anaerovorax sp. IOR16]